MTATSVATSAPRARSPRRPRDWWLVAAWLGALAVVRAGTLQERDPYWQIRAGLENLDGQPLVRPDAWSWDPVSNPFSQTSPAWNDALGLAYRTAGFAGFFVISTLSLFAYLALLVAIARRLGARPLPLLGGSALVLLAALPMLSPRATLVAQSLFLLGVLLTDRWRLARRRTLPLDLAVVAGGGFVLAWAGSWLHLSWVLLAPASAVAWAVLWWATPEVTTWRRWSLVAASGAGLCLGVLAGPYGTSAWAFSEAVRAACDGVVVEWVGIFTPGLVLRWAPVGLAALAGAGLAAAWVVRRWRHRGTDPRVGLVAALVVLALPAALAAVDAIRFVGVALLALAPVAAMAATALADRARLRAAAEPPTGAFRSARLRMWSQGAPWRVVLALVIVLVSPLVVLAAFALGRPLAQTPLVEALPRGCRLVSDAGSAGPVILLRPDVTVWIDGRADYWGRERNLAAIDVLTSPDVATPAVAGATCALLDAGSDVSTAALASGLDASPGWTRVATSGSSTLWVRKA